NCDPHCIIEVAWLPRKAAAITRLRQHNAKDPRSVLRDQEAITGRAESEHARHSRCDLAPWLIRFCQSVLHLQVHQLSGAAIMWALRSLMIHSDPATTRNTMRMPNPSASTLFVLSGAVVMCRKKTRWIPIWATARTTSPRATPGPHSSEVLATQKGVAVRSTAKLKPVV